MMTTSKGLGLYIHIPFCVEKCKYCDFLSFPAMGKEYHLEYIKSLIKEIEYYGRLYHNKYLVDTVFIGGGTPSLLDAALIAEVMTAVRANFNIKGNPEVTIESNPKTLTESKLNTYLESTINRLSIGAQSLDNGLLKTMGRIHSGDDFLENYKLARKCGFTNINIDFMFSIPGQTIDLWRKSLNAVLTLEPEHISFYSLQLEEGTPFFQMFMDGEFVEICDETDREMYYLALKTLKEMGYTHYEISNAAKDGFECKHNLKYWSLAEYLGLGLGAHSYMDGVRFSNLRALDSYIEVGRQKGNGSNETMNSISNSPFVDWIHRNTKQDDISEYIFTGLRKMQGIDLSDFNHRFGRGIDSIYGKEIQKLINDKLVEIVDGNLRLTAKGIDISNKVLAEFV